MTTISQIITDAYRQSNLLPLGATPSAAQQTEALLYLNRILKSTMGNEAGENFVSFALGRNNISRPAGYPWYDNAPQGNFFVPENRRLFCNLTAPTTVYLHPRPDDGARLAVLDESQNLDTNPLTLNANGRRIQGQTSLVLNTPGVDQEWFFRADTGSWQLYAPLTDITQEFPFPLDFDFYFIVQLAMALNPSYGVEMSPQTQATYARAARQLKARYTNIIMTPVEDALIRMPKVAIDRDMWGNRWYYYDPNAAFFSGVPW